MLIIVILLQSGEAADLAGAFGGSGSQTAFGPRGAATFLSQATTWCAVMFMFTSMVLAVHVRRPRGSGARPLGAGTVLEAAPSNSGAGASDSGAGRAAADCPLRHRRLALPPKL